MTFLDKTFGRFGNKLFQLAFCYAYARENNIDFYFQDPKFFEKYVDEIKAIYSQDIIPNKYIGIHVRRGDYVNNSFYVDLTTTDYYKNAMALFKDAEFMVYSDDIEWCKKQDIFKECRFAENDEYTDFNLMAGGQGLIIANSSFSWWAGFINKGKIIAPKLWYTDGVERTKLPNNFLRI